MKAMQIIDLDGPASGLWYQEAPVPESEPRRIAVDVDHTGVGYVEALFTEGLMAIDPPRTPGLEVSDRVRTLGDGVDGYRVGDAVVALAITGGGGYEQVAVAPAELVTPPPVGLGPVLIATVPADSAMAFAALEKIADLRRGESVLIYATAGGPGSQMNQMARSFGAGRVVGVTRSEAKRQEILGLGYDEVWSTGNLAGAGPAQSDVAAGPVAGPARPRNLDLLRMGGRLLALRDASQGQDQQMSTTPPWLRGIGVIGFSLGVFNQANPGLVGGRLRHAVELVASEKFRVHVTDRLLVQEAAQAVAAARTRTTIGKIIPTHSQD